MPGERGEAGHRGSAVSEHGLGVTALCRFCGLGWCLQHSNGPGASNPKGTLGPPSCPVGHPTSVLTPGPDGWGPLLCLPAPGQSGTHTCLLTFRGRWARKALPGPLASEASRWVRFGAGCVPREPRWASWVGGALLGSLWVLISWSMSAGLEGQHGGPRPARPPGPPWWRGRPGEWLCQQGVLGFTGTGLRCFETRVEPSVSTTATPASAASQWSVTPAGSGSLGDPNV